MKPNPLYEGNSLVYPGLYTPSHIKEPSTENQEREKKLDIDAPKEKITELIDGFKVEIEIPGVSRQDFLIHSYGNILSISVLPKKNKPGDTEAAQEPSNDYHIFDKQIILDDSADTQFISAEYISGVLRIHVPKSTRAIKIQQIEIAVY